MRALNIWTLTKEYRININIDNSKFDIMLHLLTSYAHILPICYYNWTVDGTPSQIPFIDGLWLFLRRIGGCQNNKVL